MEYPAGDYDVAVIGAGHAGIEAALAAARLGCSVILFTINLDAVGNCPCNPCIGGTAKGHLVREIDALGGEMGKAADATAIQRRLLNRSKGPAVHSLRAQIDRRAYQSYMKHALELQERLDLRQAEIVELGLEQGRVAWVKTHTGAVFQVKAVIIATGTYLKGRIFLGDVSYESGPDGMFPAGRLSACLRELGVPLQRFKTGTPARVHRRSLDFSRMEEQAGEEDAEPFSFETASPNPNQVSCYLTYTTPQTHEIIRQNLDRSPLYSGNITGIGPRYCPSIEDKVVRFSDKPRHQLFIEPMGLQTEELYVQGMSSSLPEDVQLAMMRTVIGLEEVRVMRPAYAIEYDCVDPLALQHTLEFRDFPGLYGAGQFNGTSGYEEAAAQGLIAGINAARKLQGLPAFTLERASSYIGTLIDDLVTKGTGEPYRMMTSRSEYRLLLRQGNADARLTPLGHELGLISEDRYTRFLEKQRQIREEIARLQRVPVPPTALVNDLLISCGTTPISTGLRLTELLRRPQMSYQALAPVDPGRPPLPKAVWEEAAIQIRYEGYIEKQLYEVAQAKKLEEKLLPPDLNYEALDGIRLEARQKLQKLRPQSIGQASRISGVSAADISMLLVYLEQREHGVS